MNFYLVAAIIAAIIAAILEIISGFVEKKERKKIFALVIIIAIATSQCSNYKLYQNQNVDNQILQDSVGIANHKLNDQRAVLDSIKAVCLTTSLKLEKLNEAVNNSNMRYDAERNILVPATTNIEMKNPKFEGPTQMGSNNKQYN